MLQCKRTAKMELARDETTELKLGTCLAGKGSRAKRKRPKQHLQIYQAYEEAGTDLAQALGRKEAIAKQKNMDPDVAKALGKLSSGLYVVTAAHSDAKGAMIASWVAQASFEPLGLTIAVAKDRAIESLMQVCYCIFLEKNPLARPRHTGSGHAA
jgi:hypothetical protein